MSNNGARSGITRALKFTPDIKFVNDETLNEFVVTVERRDVVETDVKNDRDSDREYRDKRDEEDRDNSLPARYIENNWVAKRDNDGAEEAKDRTNIVRIPYKQLSNVQKDIIQFCSIPRTATHTVPVPMCAVFTRLVEVTFLVIVHLIRKKKRIFVVRNWQYGTRTPKT